MFDESLTRRRFSMTLIAVFAAAAFALAMVGLYGVVALSVSNRREIGVRMTLGAQTSDVMRMIFGEGLGDGGRRHRSRTGRRVSREPASGLAAVWHQLGERRGLLVAAALIVIVALVAILIPAHRATRVGPTLALRGE
jgi:putative ABC transport system permease protein